MNTNLKYEHLSKNQSAKILVVFGGSEVRRDDIIKLLLPIENLTIYGTLSEQEGLAKIVELGTVDMVLIGGRYTERQRTTLKGFISTNYPTAYITEPGFDYPYSNETIFNEINKLTNYETSTKI